MPTLSQTFLLVTASLSLCSAAPIEEQTGQSFSIHQVRNADHVKVGALALAQAYHKYGAPLPGYLASALGQIDVPSKRAAGSVLTVPVNQFDSEYLSPVNIGTPPQTLNLTFDTGSADLWVFGSGLSQSAQAGHSVYNAARSTTAKSVSGYSWNILYGDGSGASGNVYTDVVNVGGVSFTTQAVEPATSVSATFTDDTELDGILGLAFSSVNAVSPKKQRTFFDNVRTSLNQSLFAADLKHNAPGSFDFGYTNSTKYSGTIGYTPVNSAQGFWNFTASSYKVGSTSYATSVTGIADTGTTLLLLSDDVVNIYYSKVPGSQFSDADGGWVFPCSSALPTFTYVMGARSISIPARYLNWSPASGSTCFGGIQSSYGLGTNIFGTMALKAGYVVFNNATVPPQLGFANKTLV